MSEPIVLLTTVFLANGTDVHSLTVTEGPSVFEAMRHVRDKAETVYGCAALSVSCVSDIGERLTEKKSGMAVIL